MIKFFALFLLLLSGCNVKKSIRTDELSQEAEAAVKEAIYFESLLASAVSIGELEKRNVSGMSLFFEKNSSKSFSGHYKETYESGNPKMLCQIKGGQLHGDVILWYESGKVKMLQAWNRAKAEGKFISFREDGSRLSSVAWEDGVKIEDDTKLNPDGTISEWPLILNAHTPGPQQPQSYQPTDAN